MASSVFLASPILLLILFHFLFVTEPTCSSSIPRGSIHTGFRVTLTHVGSGKNLTKNQYSLNALSPAKDMAKSSTGSPRTSPLKAFKDEYVMNLAIGTIPVHFSAIIDTGSDLIWTKCKPKTTSSSRFFDPSKSSSFTSINDNCDTFGLIGCKQTYTDGKSISVTLGQETLTIGNVKIPNVIFACGIPIDEDFKYDGIVGMGRGKLSLVSQLKERVFLYCLASRFGQLKRSILLTGSEASSAIANTASRSHTKIQTMPLLSNNKQWYESFYYISLEGISVGETRLPVTKSDFAMINGNGGMIIDSGAAFTYLEERIVNMIKDAFMNQTKLEKFEGNKPAPPYNDLDLCFKSSYDFEIIPKLVFHFEGADWELPRENYIYEQSGLACLAIVPYDKDQVSVFGNMQQQNMMVLYDLDKNSLSFMPANCNEL